MTGDVSHVYESIDTLALAGSARAATPVPLGTADTVAVLAGSAVTNTGPTVVTGDLGLSPGTSVTGFPPGTVNGTQHITDPVAAQAQTDLTIAYNNAAAQATTGAVSADLGGQALTPGVYTSASSLRRSDEFVTPSARRVTSVASMRSPIRSLVAAAILVSPSRPPPVHTQHPG